MMCRPHRCHGVIICMIVNKGTRAWTIRIFKYLWECFWLRGWITISLVSPSSTNILAVRWCRIQFWLTHGIFYQTFRISQSNESVDQIFSCCPPDQLCLARVLSWISSSLYVSIIFLLTLWSYHRIVWHCRRPVTRNRFQIIPSSLWRQSLPSYTSNPAYQNI